jgi:hypothetical protein
MPHSSPAGSSGVFPAAPPGGGEQPADQSHPLHALDRVLVDRLLATETPAEEQLVDAARLLMRYEGFPGARDLQDDLAKVLRLWGLNREELHERTRAIWAGGFRPAPSVGEAVGSGFDTTDQEG